MNNIANVLIAIVLASVVLLVIDDRKLANDEHIKNLIEWKDEKEQDHFQSRDLNSTILKLKQSNLLKSGPVVLKEYKLMFFENPKCASTSTLFLLSRMLHNRKWDGPRSPNTTIPHLKDFSIEEASNMMISDNWTRMVILRDPKERLLSAYLGKEVAQGQHKSLQDIMKDRNSFRYFCCKEPKHAKYITKIINGNDCWQHNYSFLEFIHITNVCPNGHWDPQVKVLSNHSEFVNFVIDFNNLASGFKALLTKLGKDVWLRYGSTGWGKNGTGAVFEENFLHHSDAHEKHDNYYTPELEKIVEKRYSEDYAMLKKFL